MKLQEAVTLYIEGLESPSNAWGVHFVNANGRLVESDAFLQYLMQQFGRDAVDTELNKRFKRDVA